MSARWVPLPRVVDLAEAEAAGLSQARVARRVRTGEWSRLAPAVFCTGPPHGADDLVVAAARHAAPYGMLTGAAALGVWGFEKLPPLSRPTVLVPYEQGIRSTPLIAVRRAAHLPVARVVDGLAVAPLSRAVADHAVTLRWLDDVRALVARAVQRHGCSVDDLFDEVPRIARRGSGKLRQALAEVAAGARSAPEARAARTMLDAGLSGFEPNASLGSWGLPYVADFLWRGLRAVLEIDSVEYHYDSGLYTATLGRDADLKAHRFDVLHIAPTTVLRTPELFLTRVRRWLTARADDLGQPLPWRTSTR